MELADSTIAMAGLLVFAISAVFAALGLGGGMLYVPTLTWLGLPLKSGAIPLGLLLNGLNTLLAFLRYWREGLVDFRGGTPAAIAALLLAPLGAWSAHRLPLELLLGLFVIGLVVAGVRSLRRPLRRACSFDSRTRVVIGLGTGCLAGFAGGLLGLGGGFILAPALMELGYAPKQAAATTAYIVTFSSFSGFLSHATLALPEPRMLFGTVLAVLVGSQLGAWYMTRQIRPEWLKFAYGLLLLGVAARLAWDLIR